MLWPHYIDPITYDFTPYVLLPREKSQLSLNPTLRLYCTWTWGLSVGGEKTHNHLSDSRRTSVCLQIPKRILWSLHPLALLGESFTTSFLSESESHSVVLTLCDPIDYTVHGILRARILEWVAIPFSRGSSQLRDQTQVSHIVGGFFTNWAIREILSSLEIIRSSFSRSPNSPFADFVWMWPFYSSEKVDSQKRASSHPTISPTYPLYTAFSPITANHLWQCLSKLCPFRGTEDQPHYISPASVSFCSHKVTLHGILSSAPEEPAIHHQPPTPSILFWPHVPSSVTAMFLFSHLLLNYLGQPCILAPETALECYQGFPMAESSGQFLVAWDLACRQHLASPLAWIISKCSETVSQLCLAALGLFSTQQSECSCVVLFSVDRVLSPLG